LNKLILLLLVLCYSTIWSQNSFRAVIKDSENNSPLVGANIILLGTTNGASSDESGFLEIYNIPNGRHTIKISYIGYQEKSMILEFPLSQSEPIEILLAHEGEEIEDVFVSATRTSRTIDDIPTRVEVISGEELEEKANMKPGDIRMLLNESTGIQVQQTSATSYNSSIRIQGLDGKYTHIMRDGYPLYSGFSGGLSLLQIVPLDLQQVEVIKGSSSTLYGGGAIAGLVQLVSKSPGNDREFRVMLNATSALGFDASAFYSEKFNKIGTVVFVSYNAGKPYDPADIGLTAIPKFNRLTVNPKLFYYFNENTLLQFGLNTIIEERIGGDVKYIEGNGDENHSYFEENNTTRFSTQLGFDHRITETSKFSLKNSISYFDRSIIIPDFEFSGVQLSSFSEANYSSFSENMEWIVGVNLWTDRFTQNEIDTTEVVDYDHITAGVFLQNTWNASKVINLETGLRFDYQNVYGSFFLPRIALLVKAGPDLTFRFGGGLGYNVPTVFTEDAERLQFQNVLPIDVENTQAEKSSGLNLDINYRTVFLDHFTFSINTLFFYTRIDDPLVLIENNSGQYEYQQPEGFLDTKGLETNIKFTYGHFKLFIGYTYADVNQNYNNNKSSYPLVANHRLNNVLVYEVHDNLRIGLEAYYFSPQKLNDGSTGRAYWIFGLMTEKRWEGFSLFLNFENFTDTRQTKWGPIYTGSITDPTFNDIYAPLDGFVINGGVKISF
jgi:outer membrane receptor for ferrienterochelin and colicins